MKQSRLQIVAVSGAFVALIGAMTVATCFMPSCTKEETNNEYPEVEVLSEADKIADSIVFRNMETEYFDGLFDGESLKLYAPRASATQKSIEIPIEVQCSNGVVLASGHIIVTIAISTKGKLWVRQAPTISTTQITAIGNCYASIVFKSTPTVGYSQCFSYSMALELQGSAEKTACTPQDPESTKTYCLRLDGQPNITEPVAVWIYPGGC
jgi:hypothetical protein